MKQEIWVIKTNVSVHLAPLSRLYTWKGIIYSIYKHYLKEHNTAVLNNNFLAHFNVIKKINVWTNLTALFMNNELIDWVGGPDRKIFGPRSWRTDQSQWGPCAMTSGQIFSHLARPNSVNKHFIIWPPYFSFFHFFFFLRKQNWECCSFWPKSRDLYSKLF